MGSHAVEAFLNAGHEVTAIYRNKPPRDDLPWDFQTTDLSAPEAREVIQAIGANVVIHCAALLPKHFKGEKVLQIAEINRQIDEQVVRYCRLNKIRLVYISSSSIYGIHGWPWSEESVPAPRGPYLKEKYETEIKIQESLRNYAILRCSSPYARSQRTNTVLSIFIKRAMEGKNLYYHGSGRRRQDFIAAKDAANAIIKAALAEKIRGTFNMASGESVSMYDLAQIVLKNVKGSLSKVLPSGKIDTNEDYRGVFDIEKARTILGWRPLVKLEDGIRQWIRELENEEC